MIQLMIFLLVSWFSACLNLISLKNHLKSRQIKAEVVFDSVLTRLFWRISHNHYKSKFERVWIYFRLIIMKKQLKSIQIKAWRIFESVSIGLPWRICYNWCESKSTNQDFRGFEYTSDWSLWQNNQNQSKSKHEEFLTLFQLNYLEESVTINMNQSWDIFGLFLNTFWIHLQSMV